MSLSMSLQAQNGFLATQATLAANAWATPGATPAFPESSAAALHFVADSEIYAEGEAATSFYKVISGVVRTCKFLSDGRRQIDAFYGVGEVFGFECGTDHKLSAEAVSDCTVVPFRRRGFEALAGRDDKVAGQLFSFAMRCLERAQDHALLLGRRSAAQKLAAFLLEMADRQPSGATIELAMTRQDIADYLGLTIETVSRTLSQLERDCIIALPSARRVCLKDHKALRHLNA